MLNLQDSSATLLVGAQHAALQAVSPTAHLGSHTRMPGGVDLMVFTFANMKFLLMSCSPDSRLIWFYFLIHFKPNVGRSAPK